LKLWGTDAATLTGREKAERIEMFVPLLTAVTDPVVRNDAAQRIADAFRLEFETVWSKVRGRAQPVQMERQASAAAPSAEKSVLLAAMQGRLTAEVTARLREGFFSDEACRTLFSLMKSDLIAGNPIDFSDIATHLRGEAELTLLSELSLSDDMDDQALQRLEAENLRPMERQYIERRKLEIQREIVDASKSGDSPRVAELDAEKMELSRMSSALK
jgi:hypothetical protein